MKKCICIQFISCFVLFRETRVAFWFLVLRSAMFKNASHTKNKKSEFLQMATSRTGTRGKWWYSKQPVSPYHLRYPDFKFCRVPGFNSDVRTTKNYGVKHAFQQEHRGPQSIHHTIFQRTSLFTPPNIR